MVQSSPWHLAKELAAEGCGAIADFTVESFCAAILKYWDDDAAFKRARQERKMVFMMHLSGNLEDKEFT